MQDHCQQKKNIPTFVSLILKRMQASLVSWHRVMSPNIQVQENDLRAPSCGGYDKMNNSTHISIRWQIFKTKTQNDRVPSYNQSIQELADDTDSRFV